MVGVVTDSTGAVISGAKIVLSNKSVGNSYTQTTNKQGFYRFTNVPPNEGYTVIFSHDGFSTVQVDKINLAVGITRTQDAKLAAGSTETVNVSSGGEVTLNTTDASVGNNIDVKLVNELPIQDRTGGITTLFNLQPGVDDTRTGGGGAVTGARIDQTSVTVDGLDVNDIASGATFAIIGTAPVDSVDQFSGTVAGLNPSLGTGSGGQFQLVTKGGTNRFHGNVNEYHRDTSTAANTYFNNLIGLPRTPLIRNQFGGNASGPILRNKLFFFFDFADSRIIQSTSTERTVPLPNLVSATPTLNYINNQQGCNDSVRYDPGGPLQNCISSLPAVSSSPGVQSVQSLDPAGIGFNTGVTSFLAGRYPAANDLSQGDGINTGGYRFTSPIPDIDTTYIAKIDYNLTTTQKITLRGTVNRRNAIESVQVFPTDPVTHPYIDRSYGYVAIHTWDIGRNKVNQFYYGDNISKLSFPNSYNPTGADAFSISGLSSPYSGTDGQKRRVPIPVVRDDFSWQLGAHQITLGGTFKFIKTNSNLINNFNFVGIGQSGPVLGPGLDDAVRPTDIYQGQTALNDYDAIFPSVLGVIGSVDTNYNYTNTGAATPAGSGGPRAYRYFETEAYVGDIWKASPKLTIDYGVRYQFYTVPYEAHGQESIEYTDDASTQQNTLDHFIADRLAQSTSAAPSLPIYHVKLGGKANNGPGLYAPSYKDFAPRLAVSYNVLPKTVINFGAGIVYDRTVINAIDFLQDQISYLFSNSQVNNLGSPANGSQSAIDATLANNPRVGSALAYDHSIVPPPAALTVPYTPYVDDSNGDTTGVPNQPYGLAYGETNFVINPNLKDPYSIALSAGLQQEFPGHIIMKLNYVGRLGRRLLADSDANQVIDVPDTSGLSTQTMAQAFAGLTTQTRACQNAGASNCPLTPQPWFENVLAPYGAAIGFVDNTNLVNAMVGQLAPRGDMSDMIYTLAAYSVLYGFTDFLPNNVGIPSQFGSNAYLTNQGNSNYHGLLLTVSKNLSRGLQFDFNYTWSHSIDNTSLSANNNSLFSNSGFICDILHPRACRGTSDFDVTQIISSDVIYDLPFGHHRMFASHTPQYADELIGGWSVSALPSYRTGLAETAFSDAFLASFDNYDPAIFTGKKADIKSHVNTNLTTSTVYGFSGGSDGAAKVLSEFRGPVGLEYGNRNLLRSPTAFSLDMGLLKIFPLYQEKVNLAFRADFFNILNHPNFATQGLNIVGNSSNFGQISGVEGGARVGQFSLRLEF
jgi:hypothetical protein